MFPWRCDWRKKAIGIPLSSLFLFLRLFCITWHSGFTAVQLKVDAVHTKYTRVVLHGPSGLKMVLQKDWKTVIKERFVFAHEILLNARGNVHLLGFNRALQGE